MVCAAFLAVGSTATMAVISARLVAQAHTKPSATRPVRNREKDVGAVVMASRSVMVRAAFGSVEYASAWHAQERMFPINTNVLHLLTMRKPRNTGACRENAQVRLVRGVFGGCPCTAPGVTNILDGGETP